MYKIVAFIPETVFFIFIFLPLFLVIGGYSPDPLIATLLSIVGFLTGIIWMLGVSDYMDKASGKKNTDWIFITAIIALLIAALNEIYQNFMHQPLIFNAHLPFLTTTVIIDLGVAGWLTYKVKKIFTQRSLWFLYLEILFYGFGVATLTPEIKNHFRTHRKRIEAMESDVDDNILG